MFKTGLSICAFMVFVLNRHGTRNVMIEMIFDTLSIKFIWPVTSVTLSILVISVDVAQSVRAPNNRKVANFDAHSGHNSVDKSAIWQSQSLSNRLLNRTVRKALLCFYEHTSRQYSQGLAKYS